MERCVAPSTVEPQASVQSGCSFQTVEFTSSPKKKTRRIIELPKLFHKKHHPQVDLRKYHPSPQDSSWQMKSRHFWGGIPPREKMSASNLPKMWFSEESMEKRCSSNSLDFTFGGEDFQELLTQRQYRQLGLRGGLGVFLFEVLESGSFKQKWRGKK